MRCPMCVQERGRLREDSGLCRWCHADLYPARLRGHVDRTKMKKLAQLRPENDYEIIDETGRCVWASELIARYLRETRPVGRMGGGY